MKKLCTASQMRLMDKTAMHGIYAIAPAVLMENAGHAVVEKAEPYVDGWADKDVIIFCGKGNNGGDGFVIARHLLAAGARVYVYVLGTIEKYSPEAQQHLHSLQQMEQENSCCLIYFQPSDRAYRLLEQRLFSCQVAIDAMLGTGFHGDLRQPLGEIVEMINAVAATGQLQVVAVDIPTGVNSDTGAISGFETAAYGPLYADVTVTFGELKTGLLFYPGKTCCGSIELDPIGMPLPLLAQEEPAAAYVLEEQDIVDVLQPRAADSHKGTHGTIGIVTGCSDMAGAALMSSHGAVRSGAGKVFLRVPKVTAAYCIGQQPEIMVKGIGREAYFTAEDSAEILAECDNWTAIAMGPGMGKDSRTRDFLMAMIEHTTCPLVLDADALNLLAGHLDILKSEGQRIIMTPHLAEFSRMSGLSMGEIKKDIIQAAKSFVKEWSVNLVLKGAPTLIVSPQDLHVYVNPTGNPGMAAGGMGDILTGIITAMIGHAGIENLSTAACCGVYLHGRAGDFCQSQLGPYGFTPYELADALPRVLGEMDAERRLPVVKTAMIMEDTCNDQK
jgi:NAD(P)H-hydrate epimerase